MVISSQTAGFFSMNETNGVPSLSGILHCKTKLDRGDVLCIWHTSMSVFCYVYGELHGSEIFISAVHLLAKFTGVFSAECLSCYFCGLSGPFQPNRAVMLWLYNYVLPFYTSALNYISVIRSRLFCSFAASLTAYGKNIILLSDQHREDSVPNQSIP